MVRGFIIGSLVVLLLFVGVPLFMNYEKTGDFLGQEGSIITAVFSGWIGLADSVTNPSSQDTTGSGRF